MTTTPFNSPSGQGLSHGSLPSWSRRISTRLRNVVDNFAPKRESPAARWLAHAEPYWERDSAFGLALAAFHEGKLALAEQELTGGNGARSMIDARCLNLLGVIYERRNLWSQARDCYSRAARCDRKLIGPRENLRRYYELSTLGASKVPEHLGDEQECGL